MRRFPYLISLCQPKSQNQFELTHSPLFTVTKTRALHGTAWIDKMLFDWVQAQFLIRDVNGEASHSCEVETKESNHEAAQEENTSNRDILHS